MNRKRLNPTVPAFVAVLFVLASGCSSQKNDNLDTAEQAPPPPAASNDSEMAGTDRKSTRLNSSH